MLFIKVYVSPKAHLFQVSVSVIEWKLIYTEEQPFNMICFLLLGLQILL